MQAMISAEPRSRETRNAAARRAIPILATAAVYFAAAKLGLSLAFVAEQVTVVWPPSGLALAALLAFGRGLWPGVTLGALLANATTDAPLAIAASIAVGNTLEAVAGAWLLERFGFRATLDRLRDVILLFAAAGASTAISASIGVSSLCAGGVEPWGRFATLWWVWWLGDAVGDLIVAPLLLVWSAALRAGTVRRRAETALLLAATVLVCLIIFAGRPFIQLRGYPLHYTIFPFVVWAAFRTGQLGTSALVFLASAFAIAGTVNSVGPLAMETVHESLIMVQLFMRVVAATALLLGAAIGERDASEQARAKQLTDLEVTADRLRLALEAARMGVWDWNIVSGAVQWTENLEQIHGMERGSFSGTIEGFRTIVDDGDRERVDAAIQRALEGSSGYEVEFRSTFPDGSVHWLATTGKVFHDPAGRPVRMLGTAIDVTERHRLEDTLRVRAEQLAQADRRKDEFLAMLAHELRNPLAPLSASLQLLARGTGDRDRFLAMADRQVKHLVRLVDDLLDVSRLTHGKITLRREPVMVADVVSHALELSQSLIDARGHALRVALPREALRVEGDAARLAQILSNLLSNAASYTPAGGSISLQVDRVGGEVVLRVSDSGVGLSSELLPQVFDPFVQGDPSLHRPGGGLGIGLTLVRVLAELHGGRVEARSAGPGEGSQFAVWLPLLSSEEPHAAEAAPASREDAPKRLRVLLVEDNRDAAESLRTLLEIWGHEVQVACDAAAALGFTPSFAPDVVLSDIGLPGMDGFELAKRLREDPAAARAILVAISGYGLEEDRRRAVEAGFDEHLVKPVDLDRLRGLLIRAG